MYKPNRISILQGQLSDAGIKCGLEVEQGVVSVVYDESMTEEQRTEGDAIIAAFDFDVPDPDVEAFKAVVFQDADIPVAAKVELVKFFPLVNEYATREALLQQGWAAIVAAYSEAWLTADVRTIVEAHAEASNVPLV